MSLPDQKTQAEAASKYAAIRAEVEQDRILPWTSAPAFEIGSFLVNPLSLRSMADLTIAGNAFFTDETPNEGDLIAYIWRHHPEYSPGANPSNLITEIAEFDSLEQLSLDTVKHLNTAFEESPNHVNFGGASRQNGLPAVAPIAAICHEYGAAYGVNPREVADIDLRIVFQCCRAIRMSKSDVKYLEPEKLRKAKSDFLKAHG
jgi:hypothetical protein